MDGLSLFTVNLKGNMQYVTSPTIYIGLFWLNSAETVPHKIASLKKSDVISAVQDYISRLNVDDTGYADFCKNGVAQWDGKEISSIEIGPGKLIMFSTSLEGDTSRLT